MPSVVPFRVSLVFTLLNLLSCPVYALETTHYFYNDLLGSPVVRLNHFGDSLWQSPAYRPYGERETSSVTASSDIGYSAKVEDAETGLTYVNARYYDSRMGRFISVDPVDFVSAGPAFFNRYVYAYNNPYAYVDPTGAIPWPILAGLGATAFNNLQYLSGELPQRKSLRSRMQESIDALPATMVIGMASRLVPGTTIIKSLGQNQTVRTYLRQFGANKDLKSFVESTTNGLDFTVRDMPGTLDAMTFKRVLKTQLSEVNYSGNVTVINPSFLGIQNNLLDTDLLNKRVQPIIKDLDFNDIQVQVPSATEINLLFMK